MLFRSDIAIGFGLQKGGSETAWSGVQSEIINNMALNKTNIGKYLTLKNFILLKADRRELDFEEVHDDVEKQLNMFIQTLKQFEEMILDI